MILFGSDYPGMDGFLGTRGSFMLDFVFAVMFAVVMAMGWSIWLAKYRASYQLHKHIQLTLGIALLLSVIAFEVDIRLNGWSDRATPSPYWMAGSLNDPIDFSLIVHLMFAIPTPFVWGFVMWNALKRFPNPAAPNEYSASHRFWSRIAAIGMALTAATGWVFYWLAFAAT